MLKYSDKKNNCIRNRRFISHGHCVKDDIYWKPHAMALDPVYTEFAFCISFLGQLKLRFRLEI